jgi:dTDP-4-amino-4,6-dideoxygalactose transaminase|tara:strand:- start:1058 stop:2206 length:1149 start_codon:yes stop_codon:yes gene_type:complete
MSTWKVPFFDLCIGQEEKDAVISVLESNWLTAGPRVNEFEEKFAGAFGGGDVRAVALSSGTAALHLGLMALGIGKGDEVIVPSLTFVATANAARYVGAVPVFADIVSEQDLTIDPRDIRKKITGKTKAIIPMHFAGYPCNMDEILSIAGENDLKILEDACHAPGVAYKGKMLGTIGDAGCFSFYSNKNMITGEGGMLITSNDEIDSIVRVTRTHGISSSTYSRFKGHSYGYDVANLGYNYRMDEIRAALGKVQLSKLPGFIEGRGRVVRSYISRLSAEMSSLTIPFSEFNGKFGYHVFSVILPEDVDRNVVIEHLKRNGIQTSIHYKPVHTFTDFEQYPADLPVTNSIAGRLLSLPLYPHMGDEEISLVMQTLKSGIELNGK